jgi:putative Ca2+/H+ antiporter (TMEM165/GDT1 family)
MLEMLIAFIKTLPHWRASVVEGMIVAIVFMTCVTFLAGIWCGLRIIGRRANSIQEIQFFPPRIIFKQEQA